MKVARERRSTVITISDVEELGVEKAVEIALEYAWKDAEAVFLSFDIDSIDSGFVPGTGSPEPGGLLPREALKALRMVAREGICGMEVVEIAPPYDVSDMTAQLGARAIMDVLGTMVEEGHLGSRPSRQERERREHEEREAKASEEEQDELPVPVGADRGTGRIPHGALRGRAAAGGPGDCAAARASSRVGSRPPGGRHLARGGGGRRCAGAARLGAWWGAGHAAALVALGVPLIVFKAALPGWLETGSEKAIGMVILALAGRVVYKWVRGDYRASAHAHDPGHPDRHGHRRHLRRAGSPDHRHVQIRTRGQAASMGLIHGLAGTGTVVVLLIAALPGRLEAALALASSPRCRSPRWRRAPRPSRGC